MLSARLLILKACSIETFPAAQWDIFLWDLHEPALHSWPVGNAQLKADAHGKGILGNTRSPRHCRFLSMMDSFCWWFLLGRTTR